MKQVKNKCIVISIILMLLSTFVMTLVNSDFGKVKVSNIYIPDQQGNNLHAVLYKPASADFANPAPAVLSVHGGNVYLDQMSNISLEMARRGYVVLNLDCNGCGFSDYSASSEAQVVGDYSGLDNDGGVTAALEALLGYDFVDSSRVSLTGHSMGGTYITNAALAHSDSVNSILVIGSGSFLKKLPTMDPAQLTFNVGYINGRYDEFVVAATQVRNTQDLLSADFVLDGFNITDADRLIPGQTYGAFENGTARVMYTPSTSHTGNLVCNETITDIMEFFDHSMGQVHDLAYTNHTYMIKETFGFLGIAGFALFLIGLVQALASTTFFAETVNTAPASSVTLSTPHRLIAILLTAAIPVLLLYKVGLWIPTLGGSGASKMFPALWANTYAGWALSSAIVTLALFLIWHAVYGKKHNGSLASYGLSTGNGKSEFALKKIGKSVLLSLIVFSIGYILLYCLYMFSPVEFRVWTFGLKPMSALRWKYFPVYFVMFLIFGIVSTVVNIAFAYNCSENSRLSSLKQYGLAILGSIGGTAVLGSIFYWGLRITKYPPLFVNGSPNAIVLNDATFFMVPTFLLVCIINTTVYRKTKNAYISMFLGALLLAAITITGNGFTY